MVYCAGKLIENLIFIKAIDHTFYGFTGLITHLGCWENTRKAYKPLAFGSGFTGFSPVLPTFSLKKAVKNRVLYYGENCNRGQFISL